MRIVFNAECHRLLVKYVPFTSESFAPLAQATRLNGIVNTADEFAVDCSDADGALYLETAKAHFLVRLREVELALAQAVRQWKSHDEER